MNLQEATTDKLRRRKAELEYLASMSALAAGEIPQEVENDISCVVNELVRRKERLAPPIDWSFFKGKELEGYTLEKLLGEGLFSYAFLGRKGDSGSRVFKIGKIQGALHPRKHRPHATCAFALNSQQVIPVEPDSSALLSLESAIMQQMPRSLGPMPGDPGEFSGHSYYSMPEIRGQTLRELLSQKKPALRALVRLARELEKAELIHGDLKPEHILVSSDGVKVIDPGFLGPLPCADDSVQACAVTSPLYYPLLEADDLYALGLMVWEVVLGVHPLLMSGEAEIDGVGAELVAAVEEAAQCGRTFIYPILNLRRPLAIMPDLSEDAENTLLHALRLGLDESGKIVPGGGFESFTDFAAAVEWLVR